MKILITTCGFILISSPCLAQSSPKHMNTIDHATITDIVDGDLIVDGKIDGASRVNLVSRQGSIVIRENIDGGSNVELRAAGSVSIGDKIDNPNTRVKIIAGNGASVGGKIDGGAQVWISGGRGDVSLGDKIDNSNTVVTWCGKQLNPPRNGVNGGSRVVPECN